MNFSEYQKESRSTARYPIIGEGFVYPTLGLVGEAGELAEKVKKLFRDKDIQTTKVVADADKEEIEKELGDVLWYLAQIATEFEIDLNSVAEHNLAKLKSRLERNQINGDGDNR